jgi:hypothetical protein
MKIASHQGRVGFMDNAELDPMVPLNSQRTTLTQALSFFVSFTNRTGIPRVT